MPGISDRLTKQLVSFVHQLRDQDLKKLPSISETVDWARVMVLLHADRLDTDTVRRTLNVLLKFESDIESLDNQIGELTRKATKG